MADIFIPTGKAYDTPNWNVPDQAFPDNIENDYLKIMLIFLNGTPERIRQEFQEMSWLKVDQPCIAYQMTKRTSLSGGAYMYPLQYAIEVGNPVSTITTILDLGSPKKFKGYDPFKHILNLAVTTDVPADVLVEYIETLINNGMSFNKDNTVSTSSTEQGIHQYCQHDTAFMCAMFLLQRQDLSAESKEKVQKIYQEFGRYGQIKQSPPSNSISVTSVSPNATATATTITPLAPPGHLEPTDIHTRDRQPAPKVSWHDTVSLWCKEPKAGMAKTASCIVALAIVVVATKLLYNRFLAKKTESPSQIIITNKSGTVITLSYKTKASNDLTSITLNPDDVQSLDLNTTKLNLIVTAVEPAKAPLPINLERYRTSVHQKNSALHITIYKNSGLRSWLSGISYTYTATWQ